MMAEKPLIQVRTPTYRRPDALRRALQSVIDQSWEHWLADVYDDDPERAAQQVCTDLADPRIRYHANAPQRFASKNIDACFSADNPNDADYFCVVEDDNFLLPGFFEENLRLCREQSVKIVLRNQLIERQSATPLAHLSENGVLDELFIEGLYEPDIFRMSLLIGIGVSNGGLFWSKDSISRLEIAFNCTATVQEYLRTYSIDEPIYVAMTPLAVWAENAEQTTRNAELRASYLRRELDLKRQIQALQRLVWRTSTAGTRDGFLTDRRFVAPAAARSKSLAKALISYRAGDLGFKQVLEMVARGVVIRSLGRLSTQFGPFIESRARPRA